MSEIQPYFTCPRVLTRKIKRDRETGTVSIEIDAFKIKHNYAKEARPVVLVVEAYCKLGMQKQSPRMKLVLSIDEDDYVVCSEMRFDVKKCHDSTRIVLKLRGSIRRLPKFDETIRLIKPEQKCVMISGIKYKIHPDDYFTLTELQKKETREETIVESSHKTNEAEPIQDINEEDEVSRHDEDSDFVAELESENEDSTTEERPQKKQKVIRYTSSDSVIDLTLSSTGDLTTALSPISSTIPEKPVNTIVQSSDLATLPLATSSSSDKMAMDVAAARAVGVSTSTTKLRTKAVTLSDISSAPLVTPKRLPLPPFIRPDAAIQTLVTAVVAEEKYIISKLAKVTTEKHKFHVSDVFPFFSTIPPITSLPIPPSIPSFPPFLPLSASVPPRKPLWGVPELPGPPQYDPPLPPTIPSPATLSILANAAKTMPRLAEIRKDAERTKPLNPYEVIINAFPPPRPTEEPKQDLGSIDLDKELQEQQKALDKKEEENKREKALQALRDFMAFIQEK